MLMENAFETGTLVMREWIKLGIYLLNVMLMEVASINANNMDINVVRIIFVELRPIAGIVHRIICLWKSSSSKI